MIGFHLYLQASIAKLETSVSVLSDKLELKVYGFNNKLPVLLSKLLATAKSFLPTDDRFQVHTISLCIPIVTLHVQSCLISLLVKITSIRFFLISGV